jgi:hypothetical protein
MLDFAIRMHIDIDIDWDLGGNFKMEIGDFGRKLILRKSGKISSDFYGRCFCNGKILCRAV